MRGEGPGQQPHMWSYVPLEQRIPTEHPLRPLRAMVDAIVTAFMLAASRVPASATTPECVRWRCARCAFVARRGSRLRTQTPAITAAR